jgi:hypothetical protein
MGWTYDTLRDLPDDVYDVLVEDYNARAAAHEAAEDD